MPPGAARVFTRWPALIVLALCACAPAAGTRANDASELHFDARTEFVTGATSGGVSGGPSAEELAAEIRTKLPSLQLENDGRLAELAARVAVATQDKRRAPGLTELDALARDVGFVGPVPFIGVLRFADGKWDRLDDYFAAIPNNMRFNRLGVSVLDFGGAKAGAVALAGEHLALSSVPRKLPESGSVSLRGKVDGDYHNPELVWTRPDGSTRRSGASSDGSIHVDSGPLARGVHRIEILATGPAGLEVLANFPLAVGVDLEHSEDVVESVDESDPKAAMLTLTNAARRRAGLGVLADDPALDAVGDAHSRDMVSTGFFGHQSPTTGNVEDRMHAAHLDLPLVGENVARAPSAAEAHAMLMASPGHRDNILNPHFSRMGVGVVLESEKNPPALTVTEVFGAYPSPLTDPAAAASASFAAIAKRRSDEHLSGLARIPAIDAAARLLAERVAAEANPNLAALVPAVIGKRLSGLVHGAPLVLVSNVLSPEDIARDEHIVDPKMRRAGVALAQSAGAVPKTVAVVILAP